MNTTYTHMMISRSTKSNQVTVYAFKSQEEMLVVAGRHSRLIKHAVADCREYDAALHRELDPFHFSR